MMSFDELKEKFHFKSSFVPVGDIGKVKDLQGFYSALCPYCRENSGSWWVWFGNSKKGYLYLICPECKQAYKLKKENNNRGRGDTKNIAKKR